MGDGNDFLKSFSSMMARLDENLLITLSSRGLYKRARKDFKKNPAVQIEQKTNSFLCVLPDQTQCLIPEDIQSATCSCPSRSFCRHRLLAIFYLKEHPEFYKFQESETNHTSPRQSGDFASLAEIQLEDLRKLLSKTEFSDLLFRSQFELEFVIEEGSLLTVCFSDEKIRCVFPPLNPLMKGICSCPKGGFCLHRAEAIVRFQLEKGILSKEKLVEVESFHIPTEPLTEIQKWLEEFLQIGLSKLSESILPQIESLAIRCHKEALPDLENLLRTIHTDLELHFRKHASFSPATLRRNLTRLFTTVSTLEKGRISEGMVVGRHRTSYRRVPPLQLNGMGAEAFHTKSGFQGVRYFFYCENLHRRLSWSQTFPESQDRFDLSLTYLGEAPWQSNTNCKRLSHSQLKLLNAKLNDDGRISSGQETRGYLLGNTKVLRFPQIVFERWEKLIKYMVDQQEKEELLPFHLKDLYVLKIKRWGKPVFDSLEQIFSVSVDDLENQKILLQVSYTTEGNKKIISNLERLEEAYPPCILARVFIQNAQLLAYPIAGYYPNEVVVNWSLDEESRRVKNPDFKKEK